MKKLLLLLMLFLASPALSQLFSSNQSSPVAASSLVIANPAYLHGMNVTSGASAGYIMLFDATSVPADGTVSPARCIPIAATTGVERTFPTPLNMRNGVVLVFSTTGCFTKTASATAFLAVDIR